MTRGKPKLVQITEGESTLNFVIWCQKGKGSKLKNLQITELKSKKETLHRINQKPLILHMVNIY